MANSVEYLIDIQARMQGGAKTVTELTEIERAMKKEEEAIRRLESAQKRLANSTNADAKRQARLNHAVEEHRYKLAVLAEGYADMASKGGKEMGGAAAKTAEMGAGLKTLAERFGVSAEQAQRFGKWAKVALVVFAVVKAGQALWGVFRRATDAAISYGKALVGLGMKELDRAANDKITYEAYTRSADSAAQADANVRKLADRYGVAQKDLSGFAVELMKAGVGGDAFNDAMRAAAIRAAAFGTEAVDMEDIIARGPKGMRDYARAMELAYGSTALKRGQTFEAGIERMKRKLGELMASPAVQGGLGKMFGAVEGFLNSEKGAAFFDKIGTSAGKAMTAVANFVNGPRFDSLIESAGSFVTKLGELAPAAIEALSSIKSFALGVANTIASVLKAIGKLQDAIFGKKGAIVDAAADVAGGGDASKYDSQAPWAKAMRDTAPQMQADGVNAGSALGQGLVQGMVSQIGAVSASGAALGAAARAGLESEAEINSPSRVFARLGGYVSQGFAQGVEAGTPEAESAVARLAQAPDVRPTSGGARTLNVGGVNLHGVKDAEHAVKLLEERLAALLEGVAMEGGAA